MKRLLLLIILYIETLFTKSTLKLKIEAKSGSYANPNSFRPKDKSNSDLNNKPSEINRNDSFECSFDKHKNRSVIDLINSEIEECLIYEDRSEQNERFDKIKCPSHLKPIRLTQSSSVFGIRINGKKYIIKRYVHKGYTARQEDKIAIGLNHKNIIKTFQIFPSKFKPFLRNLKEEKVHWMIAEYLNESVSAKKVKKREETIKNIIRDVCEGLVYLHKNGIAHLDLKMGNIMGKTEDSASRKTTYKIIDFGFARNISEGQEIFMENKYYGTFPFAPPEIHFDGIYSQKADVWCLGAIAYFLATDKKLFYTDGERDYDEYEDFLSGNQVFYFDRKISQELRNFVIRCMKVNRSDRPTSKELLSDPFLQ